MMLSEELYKISIYQLIIAVALLFFFALFVLLVTPAFPIVQCPDINGMPVNYPDDTDCVSIQEELEEEDEKLHEEWAEANEEEDDEEK